MPNIGPELKKGVKILEDFATAYW